MAMATSTPAPQSRLALRVARQQAGSRLRALGAVVARRRRRKYAPVPPANISAALLSLPGRGIRRLHVELASWRGVPAVAWGTNSDLASSAVVGSILVHPPGFRCPPSLTRSLARLRRGEIHDMAFQLLQ